MSVKCRNEGESSFNTGEPDSLENNKEKSKTDVLTGLYHRSKLDEMFETEYKNFRFCGVMVLDINDLHKLNKTDIIRGIWPRRLYHASVKCVTIG